MIDARIQAELNTVIAKLDRLGREVQTNVKGDLREAATIIVSSIKGAAPVGTAPHSRYSGGKVVATYKPGNWRRSIQVLPLRRAKKAVLVGPKSRGGSVDGFYARFLEFGTKNIKALHFIEKASAASGEIAQRIALQLIKRRVEAYGQKNAV